SAPTPPPPRCLPALFPPRGDPSDPPTSRRCGRRWLRRAPGDARPPESSRRGDARRPQELPPLPTTHLSGRDRRALVGRDRLSVAGDLQAEPQRPGGDG